MLFSEYIGFKSVDQGGIPLNERVKKLLCVVLAVLLIAGGAPLGALTDLALPVLPENAKSSWFTDAYQACFKWFGKLHSSLHGFSMSASAEDTISSGTCGVNATWVLNETTGVLTISGTGPTYSYTASSSPFYSKRYKIRSIIIEEGIVSIGSYLFSNCVVQSVTLPESLGSINPYAFHFCTHLRGVSLPSNVFYVPPYAFNRCDQLYQIIIPDSVTGIHAQAFNETGYYKTNTNWVDGVLYIGNHLITANSTVPENYTVLNGTVDIAQYAFSNNSSIRGVTIPNSTTIISSYAFSQCMSLETICLGDSVLFIQNSAFTGCSALTSIMIPESVKSIGTSAFCNCSSLHTVYFNAINCYLGGNESPFSGCIELDTVVFGKDVSKVPDHIFSGCENLSSVSLSDGITSIGCNAFYNCSGIKNIEIPDSIIMIDEWAFRNCAGLTSVIFPNSVTNIGMEAFAGCSELTTVILSDNITQIQSALFRDCIKLSSIVIPQAVSTIGVLAFKNCRGLKSINIPANTISISPRAFSYCKKLDRITVSKDNTTYRSNEEGVLFDYDKTALICYPAGKKDSIYVIPQTVISISDEAFAGCDSIRGVLLTDSITEIGSSAFSDCPNLTVYAYPDSYAEEYCINNQVNYRNRYTLTLNAMGGSGLSETVLENGVCVALDNPFYPPLPNVSKENAAFLGWFLSEYGADKVVTGQMLCNDQSLFARWATDFSISSTPRKLSYYVGDTLDTTGLALRAVCDNGETLEITNGFACTPQILTEAGPQTVTVSCGDAVTSFTVSVAAPQPDGISVRSLPTKTQYFVGDTLDLSGLKLAVHQNNDTEFVITDGYECVTPTLLQTPGQQSVTLRYNNLYTSFDISVEEVVATGLTIASPASKTEYYTGDLLSTEGLALRVSYNNGTTDVVTSGFVCTPKTLNRAGKQTITVTYEGLTVTYDVTVVQKQLTSLSITKMPKQLVYYAGDALNTKGLQLLCSYNNNDTKTITDLSAVDFTYDFSTSGQKTVTASYTENGKTEQTSFQVTVLENPEIYGENISVEAGEEFAVPVYIRGNNGIAGFKISLQYDASVLTPLRVEAGSILGMDVEGSTNTFSDNAAGNTSGTVDVMWASANNMTDNGVLFTVYFTTDPSIGGNYPIAFSYSERDTFDDGFNPVKMACTDTTITLDNSAYTSSPRIKADSVTVQKGEQVRVPIRLLYSNGINSVMVLNVNFPTEMFTYSSLENGTANVLNATATASGVQIILMNAPASTNSVLFTLILDVSEKAGGSYTVTPVDSTNSIQTESGVISVQTLPTRLYAVDQTIRPETTTVSVPVKIENNRGVMGFDARITYDPTCLRLTGITRGESLTSGSLLTNTSEPGRAVVQYSDASETTANGVVFTLEFQVLSTWTGYTEITLSYDQENTFNEAWDDVVLECSGATVYINNSYTVSFNANGATSGTVPADQTKKHNTALTLAKNTGSLAKTGYSLDGWATSADGEKVYDLGGTYTANADVTLYAHWLPYKIPTIFRDPDQEMLMTITPSYTAVSNQTAGTITWSCTEDGVFTINGTSTGNRYITGIQFPAATGEGEVYKVTITNLGGSFTGGRLIADLSENGENNVGDYLQNGQSLYADRQVTEIGTGDFSTNYWAIYRTTHDIVPRYIKLWIYRPNNSDAVVAENYQFAITIQRVCGATSTIMTYDTALGTLPTLTRTGYTFNGWFTGVNGGTQVTESTVFSGTQVTRYYAHWTANPYYLDINGSLDNVYTTSIEGYGLADVYIDGICRSSGVSDYYIHWDYGTPYEIRNIRPVTGHRYIGTNSALTGTIGSDEQNTPITLRFATNSYAIAYDANTGNGVAPAGRANVYYDNLQNYADWITSVAAEDNTFDKQGYFFTGWNTKADGSGIAFAPGDTIAAKELVDALADDPGDGSTLTLYAQWGRIRVAGDADEDGEITLQDVAVITRWLAGGWDATINEANSDVNRDGEINLKDVVLIRRYLAGGWDVVLR